MQLPDPLRQVQLRLHYTFADSSLLQRALTHRSHSASHYERLEFLGDSVLGLAVSDLLYQQLTHLPEGDLSRIRANLVKEDALYRLANTLQLADAILLGEGELRSGGKKRPSILADAVEAVIGAVYLDGGFAAAQKLVQRLLQDIDFANTMQSFDKDPKTALQEWLQGRKLSLPTYTVAATEGASHQQRFWVDCEVTSLGLKARGEGTNRRAAEKAAAQRALEAIKQKGSV
jgi:ribonuclease III